MDIWLDTIDPECIKRGASLGVIAGVTTNPAILSQGEDVPQLIDTLLSIQKGPLAIQVTATDAQGMIEQGRALYKRSERILVKIPVNRAGLVAIRQLSSENIPVLGTAVLLPTQALLAAKAGAQTIAPYFAHISETGGEPFSTLQSITEMFAHEDTPPKILVASIRNTDQIIQCARLGIDAVTIKAHLFEELIEDDQISNSLTEKFNEKWNERFADFSFSTLR